jgi:hypothetical protein
MLLTFEYTFLVHGYSDVHEMNIVFRLRCCREKILIQKLVLDSICLKLTPIVNRLPKSANELHTRVLVDQTLYKYSV